MESFVATKTIDGEIFERLILNGVQKLKANLQIVNDLNVFPIPDGDTGDNMYKTIYGGVAQLSAVEENSLAKKSAALANGMLLNARGNSGVILSQLFAGMANGLCEKQTANLQEFAVALQKGVEQAYKSVAKPVEGTILTVAREATEFALNHAEEESTLGAFFEDYTQEMKKSLDRTPELLSVLKEAGVIDSGGAGLLCIAEGMKEAVEGNLAEEIAVSVNEKSQSEPMDFSSFNENSKMDYGYCTELLLQLLNSKTNVQAFCVEELIAYLEAMGGDSIVAFQTGSVVKLHVHTFTPYKVLEYCQSFGEFLTVKIENMTLQHNEVLTAQAQEKNQEPSFLQTAEKRAERQEFALITVASGEGIKQTFKECGATVVIDGGQGQNPSIERFLQAFEEANADNIFVLPNNSNVIMAAKQAAQMYEKACVKVIETKNVGKAYAILSMLDYSMGDAEEIAKQMIENMQAVETGMVTISIRDTKVDDVEIKKDEFIAFTDKKMLAAEQRKTQAFLRLAEKLHAEEKGYMIVFYGKDVLEEEKEECRLAVKKQYPTLEFYELDGGQAVYEFIVVME